MKYVRDPGWLGHTWTIIFARMTTTPKAKASPVTMVVSTADDVAPLALSKAYRDAAQKTGESVIGRRGKCSSSILMNRAMSMGLVR